MAAPIGNRFWELRSKHGRDILFKTPKLLWEAATEYFEWIEKNPLIEVDYKGKDADRVEMPHTMPFTIHGLCLYLDVNVQYFTDFEQAQKAKKTKLSKDFSLVVTRIRETIYNQKFSGAACGFYNPSIIARDLGLTDKTDITTNGKDMAPVIIDWSGKTDATKDK
jgi:hypothetical protein